MTPRRLQSPRRDLWRLASKQHGVVTRAQLLERALTPEAIRHRVAAGRLHPVARGVYSFGTPWLTREGHWMVAVLACGASAALSHLSAAALWDIPAVDDDSIHVSVPPRVARRRPGVTVHRRLLDDVDVMERTGIPVTVPALTLLDLASYLDQRRLEAAINAADTRDLINPEALRVAIERYAGRPGVSLLRRTLDRQTFVLTDSELERRFLPIAAAAGLGHPRTRCWLNGFRVDFYWPELRLVVETDGLRYNRTPAQQSRDRLRDQVHAAAGLTCLRFTHAQIAFEPAHVRKTLEAVADRLRRVDRGEK